MNIAKSKKQKKNKKKLKKQLSTEDKFQREWQRVQNLQRSNTKLRQKVADFCQRVSQQVEKKEQLLCFATAAQTERLIHFIPKKTLPEYQREGLIFWIQSNIEDILNNPFSDHADIIHLTELLGDNLETHEQNQFVKWQKKYGYIEESDDLDSRDESSDEESATANATASEKQQSDNIDMFEDLFAEFADDDEDNSEEGDDFDDFFQDFFKEEFSRFEEFTEKQREESNALSKLLKSTSISKLFRRVAKALHPDLEQDEAAKEEKHKLMTELVDARENKDVVKIIAMYTEHVGEAPLELFNGDYEKMTILLKHQVERLEQEKFDIIEENPIQAAIYYRFHDASEAKVNSEIRKHLKELDNRTRSIKEMTGELTSLKKIKPILQQMNFSGNFFGLDEFSDIGFEDFRF